MTGPNGPERMNFTPANPEGDPVVREAFQTMGAGLAVANVFIGEEGLTRVGKGAIGVLSVATFIGVPSAVFAANGGFESSEPQKVPAVVETADYADYETSMEAAVERALGGKAVLTTAFPDGRGIQFTSDSGANVSVRVEDTPGKTVLAFDVTTPGGPGYGQADGSIVLENGNPDLPIDGFTRTTDVRGQQFRGPQNTADLEAWREGLLDVVTDEGTHLAGVGLDGDVRDSHNPDTVYQGWGGTADFIPTDNGYEVRAVENGLRDASGRKVPVAEATAIKVDTLGTIY